MSQIRSRFQVHALWLFVCVGIVAAMGVAFSTKNGEPLTRGTFVNVADSTLPAVVSITINHSFGEESPGKSPFGFKSPEGFFEFRLPEEMLEKDEEGRRWMPVSGGSGVIIRPNGYIVTNYHVVVAAEDNDKVQLTIHLEGEGDEEREFTGDAIEIVATDRLRDLAVLKVDAKDLPSLEWGDSDELAIGEWVLAVGNPLDLKGTASQGIVSQKHRKLNPSGIDDLLQTTAMINPGNSGGALVNLDGELVGINVAIASTTGRWQGVGFAIPSSQAKWVTDSIVKHGRIIQGYVGVQMSPDSAEALSEMNRRYYKLPSRSGVLVTLVPESDPPTPAMKAGLRKGDVIVELKQKDNVYEVTRNSDLLKTVARMAPGTKLQVTYYRDGKKRTTSMTIAERPGDDVLYKEEETTPKKPEPAKGKKLGIGLKVEVAEGDLPGLRVVSVEEDSAASKAEPISIRAGDIITEINDVEIASVEDASKALKARKDFHKFTLQRGQYSRTTFVEVEK